MLNAWLAIDANDKWEQLFQMTIDCFNCVAHSFYVHSHRIFCSAQKGIHYTKLKDRKKEQLNYKSLSSYLVLYSFYNTECLMDVLCCNDVMSE